MPRLFCRVSQKPGEGSVSVAGPGAGPEWYLLSCSAAPPLPAPLSTAVSHRTHSHALGQLHQGEKGGESKSDIDQAKYKFGIVELVVEILFQLSYNTKQSNCM